MIGKKISHYLILSRLGAGGMAEVFLAQDLALGRQAAIKVLPQGFDPDLRDRLLREARASARLQHPAIATFYDAGEEDGVAYIAMEYVRGETLRDRLRRGPLPPEEAAAVMTSVLEALGHAHAAGLLHRDIKPENIMVTGQRSAKLLDFGLAKQIVATNAPTVRMDTQRTMPGILLGTPGYMAPEQVLHEDVDPRTDLFTVGAVLYEALSGRPAFPGATVNERLNALISAAPPTWEGAAQHPALARVLERTLARDPAARYTSAAEALFDLQEAAAQGSAAPTSGALAIMDFENLSGDPADSWIGSAMGESLIAELSRLPGLQVVPRARVLQARAELSAQGAGGDALRLGNAVASRWLLTGSVQRMGPQLRVTASLTEVPTARPVGSEKQDGPLDQIFQIQDRLAITVARWLPGAAALPAAASSDAPSLEAYESYSRGNRLFHRLEKGSFDQARRHYEQAVARDPSFAPPYGGLAAIHALHFTFETDPQDLDLAIRYATRAIELDPTLPDPCVWLGYALWRQGRDEQALAVELKALQLDPRLAYAAYFAASALWTLGRCEESIAMYQRTLQLDPKHGMCWSMLGRLYDDLGRADESIWCFGQAMALETQAATAPPPGAGAFLGEVLRKQGRLAEARAACMAGLEFTEKSDHMFRDSVRAYALLALGRIARDQGDLEAARAAIGQLRTHLAGRPRTLGGGHLLTQALSELAMCGMDAAPYEEARELYRSQAGYDFSFYAGCTRGDSLGALARAARALGREDEAREYSARAGLPG